MWKFMQGLIYISIQGRRPGDSYISIQRSRPGDSYISIQRSRPGDSYISRKGPLYQNVIASGAARGDPEATTPIASKSLWARAPHLHFDKRAGLIYISIKGRASFTFRSRGGVPEANTQAASCCGPVWSSFTFRSRGEGL